MSFPYAIHPDTPEMRALADALWAAPLLDFLSMLRSISDRCRSAHA